MPRKPKPPQKLSELDRKTAEITERFGRIGLAAGMPIDQIRNFLIGGLLYLPQPKQCEMHAAARLADRRCLECEKLAKAGKAIRENCPDCGPLSVGMGGPRGFGKSAAFFGQICLDDCKRFPGLKVLSLRKSVKALREQIRDLLRKTLPPVTYNYREQAGTVEFKDGSFIIIGHFKDESEIDNYLGQEYDIIHIGELTTLTWDKIKNIRSCLRSSKPGWRPRMYADWNWGGISHREVKQYFYDPWKEKKEISTRYIFGTVHDNTYNNPEYVNELKSYAGWKYQSWYLGDPNFNAGAFFANFRRDVNVWPNEQIKEFDRRKVTRWFAGMDYGFSHPNAFPFGCEMDNGDIYILRVYSAAQTTVQEHAANFRDLLALYHVEISDLEFVAAGKDCFRVDKDGGTIATSYRECGIELTPVHIDRINAWSQMQELIGNSERGIRPKLFIHSSCAELINQIETAQCDEKRPGDILKQNANELGEGGDDELEAVRNLVVMVYSSLLHDAKPIQMGNYQGMGDLPKLDSGVIDIEAEIEMAEKDPNF